MNAADREAKAAMQAPDWHYQPPHLVSDSKLVTYRKVELMAAQGEIGLSLRRIDGSNRATLQTTLFPAQGFLHCDVYLTPQRAIALRDALNDYLADVRQEALS